MTREKEGDSWVFIMFQSAALNLAVVKSFIFYQKKVLRMVLRFVGDKVKVAASRESR